MLPQELDDMSVVFPASVKNLLPAYETLPKEFKNLNSGHNKWVDLTSKWFFSGLKGKFVPKDGIDPDKARRHLRACMGSWEPKHEHKIAGVAYLLSLWYSDYIEAK